jgi:glyoxylase-like metal-dependent hydrolase (beta-lactamase superfamily II)
MSWYTTTVIEAGTYCISEPFAAIEPRVGVATGNVYLVLGDQRAALIDSGMGIGDLRAEVRAITDLPCLVLNTHFHWDHIGSNAAFAERCIHHSEADLVAREPDISHWRQAARSPAARAALPPDFDPDTYRIVTRPATRLLDDGELIDLGGRTLRVVHIPGHSPGHSAFLDEAAGLLFTGDFAYRGPVFACFEGGDPAAFAASAERLAALPGVAAVCPGHNDVVRDPDWLGEFADCVEAAVSGQVEGALRDDLFTGWEVRFGELSVWLPA